MNNLSLIIIDYKYHIEDLDDCLWLGRNISLMEMLGFCTLYESMFPVIANKNRTRDTLKNIFFLCFLSILHIWATNQIFCSTNHLQQKHQNVLLFTFYKNRKWLSRRQIWQISWPVNFFFGKKMTISDFLVIIFGWISWPEGQRLFWMNLT